MQKNFLNSKKCPAIFLFFSVLAAISFRACRPCWEFMAITVGFDLPMLLIILMSVVSVLLGVLLTLKLNSSKLCDKKIYKTLMIIGVVLSAILSLFSLIYTIGYAPTEQWESYKLCIVKTLKEGALLLAVPFFTLVYPRFSCKTKKVVSVLSVVAVVLTVTNIFFPLTPYKITSDPMVIDNGSEYSIVFATNDNGNAYVEYTYNGANYKATDNIAGRLTSGKIHSIPVPYEHLRNNTYKISSTRVIEEFSYGSRLGATVTSDEYEFIYNNSEEQTWLVISDWHTKTKEANQAIANLESDFDCIMLLGDSTPGVDFEEQIISNTVEFGGQISGGTKPVLYARGNHETRGEYADSLPVYLGIDQFYYTTDSGPYSFVVLDSGEDKVDSHVEYGGMTDYGTYRADMIEWLKGVDVKNEKVISLSHAWQISEVETELSEIGWAELNRLGTRLMISGHIHTCRILGEGEGYEKEIKDAYPNIVTFIDGGKSGDNFIASMLTLNENGFELRAVDNLGNEILKEQFSW